MLGHKPSHLHLSPLHFRDLQGKSPSCMCARSKLLVASLSSPLTVLNSGLEIQLYQNIYAIPSQPPIGFCGCEEEVPCQLEHLL